MVPIVAKTYDYVVGIDTHARKHVAVLVDSFGSIICTREVRVTHNQLTQFVSWVRQRTGDNVLFAVEGTSSYGETLTAILLDQGVPVTEVKPPRVKSRGSRGKTDRLDAELAALYALRLSVVKLIIPRMGDTRRSLRILLMSRRYMTAHVTASKNTLIALLRGIALDVDARQPLSMTQYREIALWPDERLPAAGVPAAGSAITMQPAAAIARAEAKHLAEQIVSCTDSLAVNLQYLTAFVYVMAPCLLDEPGIGPVSAAQILCSYSHTGRIHSAAAFAALAGTAPIPASSGNTNHHRLNRFGDRQLNNALHTIVMARIRSHEQTKQYVEKRTKQGVGIRDIKRSLKRYLARSLYKKLESLNIRATS
jgi:transposase